MVLLAIARSPRLKSTTNFFLANLAVADSSVGVFCVLPNLSQFLSPNWILGKAMCKAYYYVWNVSYTASIVIMTVIAAERYFAIMHPFTARNHLTHHRMKVVQAVVWVTAVGCNIPYLFLFDIVAIPGTNEKFCYFNNGSINSLKGLSLANIIIWYLVPLGLIVCMYLRVASTLWTTTVDSALRLELCSTRSRSSSRGSSTHSLQQGHRRHYHSSTLVKTTSFDLNRTSHDGDSRHYENEKHAHEIHTSQAERYVASVENDMHSLPVGEQHCATQPLHSNGFVCQACQTNDKTCEDHCVSNTDTCQRDRCTQPHYKRTNLSGSRRVACERRKVVRLLVAVVLSFAICVLPHQLKVLNHYWEFVSLPHSVEVIISPVSFIMLYMNSVMNPFLYALFSSHFRKGFKESLHCRRV